MDGSNYTECDEFFKVYSNDIYLNSVNPKCGSVEGGSQITLAIDIDYETSQLLKDLKIGFQPKNKGRLTENGSTKGEVSVVNLPTNQHTDGEVRATDAD